MQGDIPQDVVEIVIEVPDPAILTGGGHTRVLVENWGTSYITGSPILPERTFFLPVRYGSVPELLNFEFEGWNVKQLDHPVEILEAPYAKGEPFTENEEQHHQPVLDLGILSFGRSRTSMLRISPYSVDELVLTYPDRVVVSLRVGANKDRDRVVVPDDLAEPSEIDPGAPPQTPIWEDAPLEALPAAASASYSNMNGIDTQCLIITNSAMNSTLSTLAEWKTRRGVYTRVVETSWIYSNVQGTDNESKIRNYITSLWRNESLEWVILGGDHSIVPSRMAYVPDGYYDTGYDGAYVPSDIYYGDINGSGHSPYDWDGDNDGLYGERTADGIDLVSEVYVGRLSATTASQMGALVDDILDYEKDPPTGSWFNRSVLNGPYLNYDRHNSPTEWNDTTDEADLSEEIRKDFLNGSDYNTYRLYEKDGIWPSQQPSEGNISWMNTTLAINPGAFMVNMGGHGNYLGIYRTLWNGDYDSDGISDTNETSQIAYFSVYAAPSNGAKKPFFYLNACDNGWFDTQWCLAEDILRDVGIGAIGSARTSWYYLHWTKGADGGFYNQGHNYRFWEQFFNGEYQPGKALALSKTDYLADKTDHSITIWKNLLEYNLLGDPEIDVWTGAPQTFNVTYPSPLTTPGNLTFTVKDQSGNPVKDARVCLMNSTSFYGFADTNSTGHAVIQLHSITRWMNLTVTAHNFKPFQREVVVGVDSTPPTIVNTSFTGDPTTGDVLTIRTSVSDMIGVAGANLEYGWSSAQPSSPSNISMTGAAGQFTVDLTNPVNSTLPLWYRVGARDLISNWAHSSWIKVDIFDNDLPFFGNDLSDTFARTGNGFMARTTVFDNVGLSSVAITYWFGTGSRSSSIMSGWPYSATLPIPANSTGTLHYFFNATDTSGNWTISGQKNVTVLDDDGPMFGSDSSPAAGTTGDPFTFNISVSDNIGVQTVTVEYWYGSGTHTNSTMSGSGTYTLPITIPSSTSLSLHYIFHAADTSGNWAATTTSDVSIQDNDAPSIGTDSTPGTGTTGEQFTFSIIADDNIGMQGVWVEYWFGTGTHTNASMSLSYPFTYQISVPSNSLDTLYYIFRARDTSGNWASTNQTSVIITDNDRPVLGTDSTPATATTGDNFTFSISLTDNIGVQTVSVEYWFGSGSHTNTTMTGSGPYSYQISVPASSLSSLHYIFHASDTSGNWVASPRRDVTVSDNDGPLFGSDWTPSGGTTGDYFFFWIYVTDNIGVQTVTVEYWFGNGSHSNQTMSGSGPYTYQIYLPSNSTSTLHYLFHASDTGGNWVMTSRKDVNITDNDRPIFGTDSTQNSAGTGENITFTISVSDNVGVHEVRVVYRFGTGPSTNTTMSGSGPYTRSISMPANSVNTLYYLFKAGDGDGNWASTSERSISVSDDDPPVWGTDSTPATATTGDRFTFIVRITDNIGVQTVTVEYWFGSGSHT
ncbi:MAG: C25 family cysteine peptidase, partial [Thermoplasmatota archaeon]